MYAITGATGQLGRLVIDTLLRTVAAGEIVAAVRNPEKASDLAAEGIEVREADYDNPPTLATALAGIDRLLLISSSEVRRRIAQHRAVIDAARAQGVQFIAYTSVLRADSSPLGLAEEHRQTEAMLRHSGIPHVVLRNGWYTENHLAGLEPALANGAMLGAAGAGRIASAPRVDYATAAAAVLTGEGHAGRTYELAGDTGWTLPELAAEITRQSGTTVAYRDLPQAEYAAALVAAGFPSAFAEFLADCDACVAKGAVDLAGDDLSRLLGRPTTPMSDSVTAALRNRRGTRQTAAVAS